MTIKKVSKHQDNLSKQVTPSISGKSLTINEKESRMQKKNKISARKTNRNAESVNDDALAVTNTSESATPSHWETVCAAQKALVPRTSSIQTMIRKVLNAHLIAKKTYEEACREREDAEKAFNDVRTACRGAWTEDAYAAAAKAAANNSRANAECRRVANVYFAIKSVYDVIMRVGHKAVSATAKKTK